MPDATLDDRGRLTLPKRVRERYGDRYRIVEPHDGINLVPVADDPLDALHLVQSDGNRIVSSDEVRPVRVASRLA